MTTNNGRDQTTVGRISFGQTLTPAFLPDKGNPTGMRQVLVPAMPTTIIPQMRFRIKGARLQQAVIAATGGPVYWRDVPIVREDEPDVE